ncbi:hypothetical protein [Cellvibrio sp.]|uniref:hypothetical protein n=1 Tax=Cellvibrio sp. TaxID=1965322 RepID=UPI0039647FCD
MKQRNLLLHSLLLGSCVVLASVNSFAQDKKVFFRYTLSDGRKVVSQTIPPQYVRNGYEMLTISGEVLKVVPPAPPEADAERIANERRAAKEQARIDLELRRTYSSVKEIESAKTRGLQDLTNTINILQANLVSVKKQLKAQEEHAATIERNGKTVTEDILKNIATLRSEEKDLNNQIKQRQSEYDGAAEKYEKEKARFIEISNQPK